MIDRSAITGLVLAGGRGSRMGGVDKGLQVYRGMPLALHALLRLQPQVGEAMINANRNLAAYESFGVPVWPDASDDYPGPLAGLLVGLERCETPYLVSVPCDTPSFPVDLVSRLAHALDADGADLAMPRTTAAAVISPASSSSSSNEPGRDAGPQLQPVFCLLKSTLMESLLRFMQDGGRKIDRWTAQHRMAIVDFDDTQAFANANTAQELRELQRGPGEA